MGRFVVLFNLFSLVLVFSFSLNHDIVGARIFSEEEDLEFERQLKILNKPPVKTVKTKESDTYDCIDIRKQPTLDHPLYQGHDIQTKPTYSPERLKDAPLAEKQLRATLTTVGCPEGTVPIRRTRKEDLVRAKSFSESYSRDVHPLTKESPGQHSWELINQSSSSQLWIENGSGDSLTSLQAGWMLYEDTLTRLFIFWRTDEFGNKRDCFNLLCSPNFIQIDNKNPVDAVLTPTSVLGGQQYIIQLYIYRDNVTGYWWLLVNDVNVGYWINTLITGSDGGASHVAWGGLAQGLPNGPSPPIGSGEFKAYNTGRTAYFKNLEIVDHTNTWADPNGKELEKYIAVLIATVYSAMGLKGAMDILSLLVDLEVIVGLWGDIISFNI